MPEVIAMMSFAEWGKSLARDLSLLCIHVNEFDRRSADHAIDSPPTFGAVTALNYNGGLDECSDRHAARIGSVDFSNINVTVSLRCKIATRAEVSRTISGEPVLVIPENFVLRSVVQHRQADDYRGLGTRRTAGYAHAHSA